MGREKWRTGALRSVAGLQPAVDEVVAGSAGFEVRKPPAGGTTRGMASVALLTSLDEDGPVQRALELVEAGVAEWSGGKARGIEAPAASPRQERGDRTGRPALILDLDTSSLKGRDLGGAGFFDVIDRDYLEIRFPLEEE
jgi:hypothetical protein